MHIYGCFRVCAFIEYDHLRKLDFVYTYFWKWSASINVHIQKPHFVNVHLWKLDFVNGHLRMLDSVYARFRICTVLEVVRFPKYTYIEVVVHKFAFMEVVSFRKCPYTEVFLHKCTFMEVYFCICAYTESNFHKSAFTEVLIYKS
jgi:hypothetical protein